MEKSENRRGANILANAPGLILILLFSVVFGGALYGQGLQVSSRWRDHFTSMPVIKNCVYQETMVFHNGEVDFYQFRWQTNAFMFRQLRNPDEAASNQISSLIRKVCYAGRFNNDAWLIHWADDPYGTLYLFPDANETWDLPPTNSDEFAIYIGNSELLDTLAYGIYVNPATVKWLDCPGSA